MTTANTLNQAGDAIRSAGAPDLTKIRSTERFNAYSFPQVRVAPLAATHRTILGSLEALVTAVKKAGYTVHGSWTLHGSRVVFFDVNGG